MSAVDPRLTRGRPAKIRVKVSKGKILIIGLFWGLGKW